MLGIENWGGYISLPRARRERKLILPSTRRSLEIPPQNPIHSAAKSIAQRFNPEAVAGSRVRDTRRESHYKFWRNVMYGTLAMVAFGNRPPSHHDNIHFILAKPQAPLRAQLEATSPDIREPIHAPHVFTVKADTTASPIAPKVHIKMHYTAKQPSHEESSGKTTIYKVTHNNPINSPKQPVKPILPLVPNIHGPSGLENPNVHGSSSALEIPSTGYLQQEAYINIDTVFSSSEEVNTNKFLKSWIKSLPSFLEGVKDEKIPSSNANDTTTYGDFLRVNAQAEPLYEQQDPKYPVYWDNSADPYKTYLGIRQTFINYWNEVKQNPGTYNNVDQNVFSKYDDDYASKVALNIMLWSKMANMNPVLIAGMINLETGYATAGQGPDANNLMNVQTEYLTDNVFPDIRKGLLDNISRLAYYYINTQYRVGTNVATSSTTMDQIGIIYDGDQFKEEYAGAVKQRMDEIIANMPNIKIKPLISKNFGSILHDSTKIALGTLNLTASQSWFREYMPNSPAVELVRKIQEVTGNNAVDNNEIADIQDSKLPTTVKDIMINSIKINTTINPDGTQDNGDFQCSAMVQAEEAYNHMPIMPVDVKYVYQLEQHIPKGYELVTNNFNSIKFGDTLLWKKSSATPLGHVAFVINRLANGNILVAQGNMPGNGVVSLAEIDPHKEELAGFLRRVNK